MAQSLIAVYDSSGKFTDNVSLDEPVEYINGRVSIGVKTGIYYKGVGMPYFSHYVLLPTSEYDIIEDTNISYLGYNVKKKCFSDMKGIFLEKYQPQFSDFIGTCGTKELSIIEHDKEFKYSSVNVLKSINWNKTDHQYYYKLTYKCNRRKYIDDGDPNALKTLLVYMIENDWNFIWDKNCISDISYNGLVTDVADIFKSSDLRHKIGTVYAVLYSLYTVPDQFNAFINVLGYEHRNSMDFVFNAVRFLHDNGIDVSELLNVGNIQQTYQFIVLNYLVVGKNCAHCSYANLGDQVTNEYIEKARNMFRIK